VYQKHRQFFSSPVSNAADFCSRRLRRAAGRHYHQSPRLSDTWKTE